jgi:hypothetical protein
MTSKSNFEIIDGVYQGPEVLTDDVIIILSPYKDTLVSLGCLRKVEGSLEIAGCYKLTSLGNLTEVTGTLDVSRCSSLPNLGALTTVGEWLCVSHCDSLTTLGNLSSLGRYIITMRSPKLADLGNLPQNISKSLTWYGDNLECGPLYKIIMQIDRLQKLPLHEVLNALHSPEVLRKPILQNILLNKLQGDPTP